MRWWEQAGLDLGQGDTDTETEDNDAEGGRGYGGKEGIGRLGGNWDGNCYIKDVYQLSKFKGQILVISCCMRQ